MLSRIIYLALLAGVVTGLLITPIQMLAVQPLIQEAERYEQQNEAASVSSHPLMSSHDTANTRVSDNEPSDNRIERALYTTLAVVLMAVGYALLLGACFSKIGSMNWRKGLIWGAAGFLVFQFAPSLGLPPEPPGVPAADVTLRQLWWLVTTVATASGLWLLFQSWKSTKKWLVFPAIVLLALPHMVGAPHPPAEASLVPEQLAANFIVATMLTAALFWLLLGSLLGHLFKRYS